MDGYKKYVQIALIGVCILAFTLAGTLYFYVRIWNPVPDQDLSIKRSYPYIGIRYMEIGKGAVVGSTDGNPSVVTNSPAEKAGIRPGDTITKIDNIMLDSDHHLGTMIRQRKVGDSITLTVVSREGKQRIVHLILAEYNQ